MVCGKCGGKMACRYSVQTEPGIRYRYYRCGCGEKLKTLELAEALIVSVEAKALMEEARRKHWRIAGAVKRAKA